MPRPPLPGSVWVHAKVKMTPEQYNAFKAQGTIERLNDAEMVTKAVHASLSRVKPKTVKAYLALVGKKASKRPPSEAPPAPRKGKAKKAKKVKARKAKPAKVSPPPPAPKAPAAE